MARRILSADRRGSSWPVLVETDDGLRFVKLRGAAQGTAPLVAEVVVGAIAESLGLNVPTRAIVELPPDIPSDDRHQELRDLLTNSVGENLGFAYLDGASMLIPAELEPTSADSARRINADDAAAIVWLDSLVMNPDRTARNSNLMWWRDRLWLIDHGAALGFQYSWSAVTESSPKTVWSPTQPHALAHLVRDLEAWDEILGPRVTREVLQDAIGEAPDSFLAPLLPAAIKDLESLRRRRAAYVAFLWKRLASPRTFWGAILHVTAAPTGNRRIPNWLKSSQRRG